METRWVDRNVKHYNLQMIIAVGFTRMFWITRKYIEDLKWLPLWVAEFGEEDEWKVCKIRKD